MFLTQIPGGRNWTFSFFGAPEYQEQDLISRNMTMQWEMNDPGDRDAGLYACRVYYVTPKGKYSHINGRQYIGGE